MQMVQPLDDLFSRTSNTRVLRTLFRLPEGMRVSTREIARRAGLAHPTVTGVMNGLCAVGVVETRRTPWATEYQLNRSHVSIPAMEALFRWETTVRDDLLAALRQEIRSRAPWVQAATCSAAHPGATWMPTAISTSRFSAPSVGFGARRPWCKS